MIGVNLRNMKIKEREFMEFAEELLSLSSVKKALGMQARLLAEAKEKTEDTLKWSNRTNNSGARIVMHLAWVDILYKAFMLGYGANEIMTGNLSVGQWRANTNKIPAAHQTVTPP